MITEILTFLRKNFRIETIIVLGVCIFGFSILSTKFTETTNALNNLTERIEKIENDRLETIYQAAYAVLNSDIEFPEELDTKPAGKYALKMGCEITEIYERLLQSHNARARTFCNYILK
jgi:hypothetical protein